MNKFVRFLLHTVILVALFVLLGTLGSGIDNDQGGSVTAPSLFALAGLPFFIILQLVFDTLEDVENGFVAFLRGLLTAIGLIGTALSFLLQQAAFASEDAGTIANVFSASLVAAFPLTMITALYFYFGLQFTDAKWKGLIAPVAGYLVSFVINLICTLLGKYVAPFFYGWFLMALVGGLIVVLIIVLIKCGSDWTERIYPSDSAPKPKKGMSLAERKLRYLLDDMKNNPHEYLKYKDVTYHTPWGYSLNVSSKRLSFWGAFTLDGYYPSREGEMKMNEEILTLLNKALDIVGDLDSDFKSYKWSVDANMTMR